MSCWKDCSIKNEREGLGLQDSSPYDFEEGKQMRERYTLQMDKQLLKELRYWALDHDLKLAELFDRMARMFLAQAGEGHEHHSKSS
jgi:hypothetical protein